MMDRIEIGTVPPWELAQVAGIHFRALPEDFLPSLGLDFLQKVYYPAAVTSANASTLAARSSEKVLGFVTIAWDSPRFTRDVIDGKYLLFGWYALRALFIRPGVFLRSFEVLWSALFPRPDPIRAEIVFIAVSPEYQKQGIGRLLVSSAMRWAAENGESICRTKTLASNAGVIRMYEKMGWRVRDAFRLIGREYLTLVSGESA
jgi:ribosomal protein S18 acetylase RimI-like enzyme